MRGCCGQLPEVLGHAGIVGVVASLVLGLAASYLPFTQVRKPSRWIGRLFTSLMNRSHSALTDWGLAQVRIAKDFTILDVGCGGGRTINKLAQSAPAGTVVGIDYAQGSVAASVSTNHTLIDAGRVGVFLASVAALPFPADRFDLVTAVETHYYWPSLPDNMRETLRVLKPGGSLLLIAEAYSKVGGSKLEKLIMKRLLRAAHLSAEEHRQLFADAGFIEVRILEESQKGWLCVLGRKPA